MDDDRAFEAWLQLLLSPDPLFIIELVLGEDLFLEFFLVLLLLLLVVGVGLLFSSTLSLVLKVKSNGQLEITLHGTALVLSAQSIVHLDIDLGAVEGTITVVVGPWAAKSIESLLKGLLGLVPLFIGSETLFRSG